MPADLRNKSGKLDYVSPTVATNTDTILVRTARRHAPQPAVQERVAGRAGSAPRLEFRPKGVRDGDDRGRGAYHCVLAIPRAAALVGSSGGDYVYVVDAQNKAQQKRIQLGQSTPSTAVVINGLKEGELVISEGLQRVRPGATVLPSPATPPPPISPTAEPAAEQGSSGGAGNSAAGDGPGAPKAKQ